MYQELASVIAFEDWADVFANVMPLPPGPTDMPTVIPLANKPAPSFEVWRSSYPMGLVILVDGAQQSGPPADLPLVWVDGDDYDAQIGPGSNNPNGVVILFRGK